MIYNSHSIKSYGFRYLGFRSMLIFRREKDLNLSFLMI